LYRRAGRGQAKEMKMSVTGRSRLLAVAAACMSAWTAACAPPVQPIEGRWDGTVVVNKVEVPFQFEIVGNGPELQASFLDGDVKVTSTSGRRDNDAVLIAFDQYATKIDAVLKDGRLEGKYDRGARAPYEFRAQRASAQTAAAGVKAPDIAGEWKIPHESNKGEQAWRFIVRQTGNDVSAAILRVDGDTGAITGSYRDGTFVLGHFDGARPLLLEVTPAADGSLQLLQNKQTTLVAYRGDDPRAQAAPEPTDPAAHTRAKDPNAVFTFSFPDLQGQVVSNTDERFRNKVLAVSMTGSWCPNCHDEAPFLTELYKKYHDEGLEVIAFAFEEADQLKNPVRLKAFMKNFGIEYPVLLVGEPEQLAEKVPQAENLNAFPTTIFVGRDGRIRNIHAGFASKAAGDFHAKGKEEVTAIVEGLLAEKATRTN
jgi:thiol-disulfide isomerase/thioredoxin